MEIQHDVIISCNVTHGSLQESSKVKALQAEPAINTGIWIAVKHDKLFTQLHSCKLTNLVTSMYSQQLNL